MAWDYLMLIGKLLLGIYCALLLIIVVRQFSMVYYPNLPSRELTTDPKDVGLAFENVQIATEDNQQLHGWYIPAQKNSDVLLFFHGNAGNISHRLDSIGIFHH